MVLEITELLLRPGAEERFTAFAEVTVRRLLTEPGCLSARLTRGLENPSRFVLLVEWETITRSAAPARQWPPELTPLFAAPPLIELFDPAGAP
ncbi:antibiotic biosynthesis monooxygenase family protein [Crossiella sp. NPDC003009]